MKHNIPKYLEDVRLSIEDIENYIFNVSSATDLEQNKLLFDGLCRRFAIIGEAIFKADKLDSKLSITSKNKIMSLRHIIVHDYDLVRPAELWTIIKSHLPLLKQEVEQLLKAFDKEED